MAHRWRARVRPWMHSDRRLSEQLSAREISRPLEVRCDGPALGESRERSLTVSPPFPLALAVLLLSLSSH
jgi:hypothetical protein